MDKSDLQRRFTHHAPRPGQPEVYQTIRRQALALATLIDNEAPDCREKSLAMTALEESVFWANAAIAREAI